MKSLTKLPQVVYTYFLFGLAVLFLSLPAYSDVTDLSSPERIEEVVTLTPGKVWTIQATQLGAYDIKIAKNIGGPGSFSVSFVGGNSQCTDLVGHGFGLPFFRYDCPMTPSSQLQVTQDPAAKDPSLPVTVSIVMTRIN